MRSSYIVGYVALGGNLYSHEPAASLALEAGRLADNRALIAADRAAWHNPALCLAVLDVMIGDALAELMRRPALIAGVTL